MSKGNAYIISGPSGVGKDTILEGVFKKMPELQFSRSCITRPMRFGETPDGKYRFITKDEFRKMLKNDDFLEYNEYCGNLYGTPKTPIVECINSGKSIIIEVDVNGARNIKRAMPECISVFILPPSEEELCRRLTNRKSDSPEAIKKRLDTALSELKHAKDYDYNIVNDDLLDAIDRFCEIIRENDK